MNYHLRHLFSFFFLIYLTFFHFFWVKAETNSVFVEVRFLSSLALNPVRAWLTSCHQLCTCFSSVISVHSVIGLPISEQKKKTLWNKFVPDESKSHFGKFKFPSAIGSMLQKPDPWLGLRFSPERPYRQKLWVLLICFINLHMIAGKHYHPSHLFHCFYLLKSKACLFIKVNEAVHRGICWGDQVKHSWYSAIVSFWREARGCPLKKYPQTLSELVLN